MTFEKRIRVLIADDHTVMRCGLVAFVQRCPDLDLVGEAENGRAVRRRMGAGKYIMSTAVGGPQAKTTSRNGGITLGRKRRRAGGRFGVRVGGDSRLRQEAAVSNTGGIIGRAGWELW